MSRIFGDETLCRVAAAGIATLHEGTIPGINVRFAYFATEELPGGLIYEISDVLEPSVYPMIEAIASAARDWNGDEPVRELPLFDGHAR